MVQGMAVFVAKYLKNVKKVSVIYGDSEAEVFGAEGLLVPKLKSLRDHGRDAPEDLRRADRPRRPERLTAAGADGADVVVPIVTVQGCIATYDAIKSLGITPPVVTTGLCFGTPMTKHLADLGSKGTVPDGWYFGDYGYSYFMPEDASGMNTYLAKVQQYGAAPRRRVHRLRRPDLREPDDRDEVLQPARARRLDVGAAVDDQVVQGADDDRGRADELRLLRSVHVALRHGDGNRCSTRTASGLASPSGDNNKPIDPYAS